MQLAYVSVREVLFVLLNVGPNMTVVMLESLTQGWFLAENMRTLALLLNLNRFGPRHRGGRPVYSTGHALYQRTCIFLLPTNENAWFQQRWVIIIVELCLSSMWVWVCVCVCWSTALV